MALLTGNLAKCPELPPTFNDTSESVLKDAHRLVSRARAVRDNIISTVTPETASFSNTLLPILQEENLRLPEKLKLGLLEYVSPDESIRKASKDASSLWTDFYSERRTDVALYERLVAALERKDSLDSESQRALEQQIKILRQNGAGLPEASRTRLREIERNLDDLEKEFRKNVDEDVENFKVWLSEDMLSGVPAHLIDELALGTTEPNIGKRCITKEKLWDVIHEASKQETRQQLHLADARRCGANVPLLEKSIVLRDEAARLLGHANHAERMAKQGMMKSIQKVNAMLDELRERFVPIERVELEKLKLLRDQELGHDETTADTKFYSWDYGYYSRKLRKGSLPVAEDTIAEYFPLEAAVEGMLEIYAHFFSMSFVAISPMTDIAATSEKLVWHEDVTLYAVWDKSGDTDHDNGEAGFLGWLYMDLYPRDGKHTYFMDFPVRPGYLDTSLRRHHPATAVLGYFPRSSPTKPSLLSHNDLILLFHEFGHAVHDLVSKTRYARFSGAETYFNEAPSQMLENWVWDASVLRSLSRHYTSLSPEYLKAWQSKNNHATHVPEEKMSHELATQYIKDRKAHHLPARHLGSVHRSIFDLKIHSPQSPEEAATIDTSYLWNTMRKDMFHLDGAEALGDGWSSTYSQATFTHLMGNQCGATYYGYFRDLVYAADMFVTAFKDDMQNAKEGLRYRRAILQPGASEDEMTMLSNFLGREPRTDAFYQVLGLA